MELIGLGCAGKEAVFEAVGSGGEGGEVGREVLESGFREKVRLAEAPVGFGRIH